MMFYVGNSRFSMGNGWLLTIDLSLTVNFNLGQKARLREQPSTKKN
ncbi:MAG: hypothetical protein F6J90_30100 [Moorea sp. SIOASIH]|nr:hypothetical protein [Moorena sp. SIOASIH]NEO40365.1 hypothetical protein [Moorena sp. SIOASIH]